MKNIFILLLITCNLITKSQVIPIIIPSIPYENYYTINDFPKSNEKISFTLPNPLVDFKDSVLDKYTTYQHIVSFSSVNDSLFSEYVKYAMLSLNYEQKFCNI